jgi:EmrB/QacA subfamily drug resistance transporter
MPDTRTSERLDPNLRKLSGILIIGIVAALLDTTVVNVAIDTLGRDLHASVSSLQWVNTAYLLTMGMVVPVSGWAAGRFGAKHTWLFSLALFLTGSVLAAVSWDAGSLIAFRVVQGAGGGLLFPIMQTLLVQAAGRQQLGRLMATIGLPAVVVPILGPVIGGLIITGLDWHWIFLINIPVCVLGLVLAWRGLPRSPADPTPPPKLDLLGLALLSPALAAALYGLSGVSGAAGFAAASVVAPLCIAAALLAAFIVHSLRTRAEPVLDLRLFRTRSFTASAALLFLSGLSLYAGMLLLPLFYQQARGSTVVATGLLLAPQGVGALISRGLAGRLTDRLGPRPVVLAGIGLTALALLGLTQAGPYGDDLLLGACLVVFGIGLSASTVPVIAGAFQGLRPEQIPHASSATRILQLLGGSFGTAVLAMILTQNTAAESADAAGRAAAFGHTFWWALAFTALAVLPALLLPRRAVDDEAVRQDTPTSAGQSD